MLDVLDLSFADTLGKHRADRTGDLLRISAVIAPEQLLDAGQELRSSSLRYRCGTFPVW
jgi:hypothetical protein